MCVCFSIALYYLKSYNDVYTDWSLYHKFVAKISAQTNNIKVNEHTDMHTQAPELLYPCLHAYTNM